MLLLLVHALTCQKIATAVWARIAYSASTYEQAQFLVESVGVGLVALRCAVIRVVTEVTTPRRSSDCLKLSFPTR